MAERFDISDKLIHFTRGNSNEHAFSVLQRRLIAGNGMIRGGYKCVCFTEAPLRAFTEAFVNRVPFTRYSQFGLLFDNRGFMTVMEDLSYISKTASSLSCQSNYVGAKFALS